MTGDRHPATTNVLKWFEWKHLPSHLQDVSYMCQDVAKEMVGMLPDSPELTAGLRRLLEAKDCFVRAAVDARSADPSS